MSELTDRALDCQLELIHWHDLGIAESYYTSMIEMQRETAAALGHRADGGYYGTSVELIGKQMKTVLGDILKYAETIAVTTEMCEVLQAAAATVPQYELSPSDLPCPCGFAFFDDGIVCLDRNGRSVVIRAVTWQPMYEGATEVDGEKSMVLVAPSMDDYLRVTERDYMGTSIALWTDPHDPRDHMHEDVPHDTRIKMPPLLYLNHFTWMFGRQQDSLVAKDMAVNEDQARVTEVIDSWNRFANTVAAFFRIVLEPFIRTDIVVPSRGVRRRRERANVNIPMDGVRVITLRRARENVPPHVQQDSEEGEWYSYRFWVRGHWRNQWYPKEQRHAPKWIEPFIKGPEHAPLVQHDHVYEWRR